MYRNCKPPSLMTGLASDSGEVSTLFSQLLHSPSSSCMPLKTHQHRQDLSALPLVSSPLEFLTPDAPSGGPDVAVAESSSSFNFSDPSAYISADVKGSGGNPNPIFSGGIEDSDANTSVRGYRISTSSDDNLAALACNMEDKETSELPSKPILRSSSKRSRTAEVHNLSEKRRRSRINEKMKALQNLIPNSNKTDKASMLDEAIEYLKQLQLQVQMLSLRKGLSLHPMSFTGIVQPINMPQDGISCAGGNGFQNASGGFPTLAAHVENSVEAAFNLSKEFVFSSQPDITKETTTTASKSPSSLHPPFRVHDLQIGHFLPTSSQLSAIVKSIEPGGCCKPPCTVLFMNPRGTRSVHITTGLSSRNALVKLKCSSMTLVEK